jgi:hypothetical protein
VTPATRTPDVLEDFVGLSSKNLVQTLSRLGGSKVSRYKLAVMLRTAVALAQLQREFWNDVQAMVKEHGMEASSLAESCLFLLTEVKENRRSFDLIRQLIPADLPTNSDLATLFRQLTEDMQAVEASEQPIREWFTLATKHPKPVDEARIHQGRAAVEAGRFKKGNDLIARLRQPK